MRPIDVLPGAPPLGERRLFPAESVGNLRTPCRYSEWLPLGSEIADGLVCRHILCADALGRTLRFNVVAQGQAVPMRRTQDQWQHGAVASSILTACDIGREISIQRHYSFDGFAVFKTGVRKGQSRS